MSVKVLIADDHSVVRQGLRTFLELDSDIEVVGLAADGVEAVKLAGELHPDVVLIDLLMPVLDGFEVTEILNRELPEIKILVLTSVLDRASIDRVLKAGADGYLLKTMDSEGLCQSIRSILNGQVVFSPQVAEILIQQASPPSITGNGETESSQKNVASSLTPRETDVLRLLSQGKTNKEIAYNLKLSEKTIKIHVSIILSKMNMQSRTQAALYAVRLGIIPETLQLDNGS